MRPPSDGGLKTIPTFRYYLGFPLGLGLKYCVIIVHYFKKIYLRTFLALWRASWLPLTSSRTCPWPPSCRRLSISSSWPKKRLFWIPFLIVWIFDLAWWITNFCCLSCVSVVFILSFLLFWHWEMYRNLPHYTSY